MPLIPEQQSANDREGSRRAVLWRGAMEQGSRGWASGVLAFGLLGMRVRVCALGAVSHKMTDRPMTFDLAL